MGISAGGGKGGPKSDINVTPLVDVVLVLLIIFLVTMPVLMRHISIEVPRQLDSDEDPSESTAQITVVAKAATDIVINDGASDTTVASRRELAKVLRPMLDKKRTEKLVFVDFDDKIDYGEVIGLMDTIRGAGAEKVALKIREEGGAALPAQ